VAGLGGWLGDGKEDCPDVTNEQYSTKLLLLVGIRNQRKDEKTRKIFEKHKNNNQLSAP